MVSSSFAPILLSSAWLLAVVSAWSPSSTTQSTSKAVYSSTLFRSVERTQLYAQNEEVSASSGEGKGYVPKWKKKSTLAEEQGSSKTLGFENVGLGGSIKVIFEQTAKSDDDDDEEEAPSKFSMAWPGQPYRDVASQAGQYIRYGCGKGECGTCECKVNGKWIRPCVAKVPALASASATTTTTTETEEEPSNVLVVQVPHVIQAKSVSSGTFFSIRSFLLGFWNNLLGMMGFVKFRKAAQENWMERQTYESLIFQKTMMKKLQRAQQRGWDQTMKLPSSYYAAGSSNASPVPATE